MKKLFLILIVFLSNIVLLAQETQDIHPLDEKLYQCIETSLNNNEMLVCIQQSRLDWQEELDYLYNRLIKILPSNQAEAFRYAHIQWKRFVDAELGFSNLAYSSRLLPEYKLYAAEKHLQLIKNRVKELEVFYWDFVGE